MLFSEGRTFSWHRKVLDGGVQSLSEQCPEHLYHMYQRTGTSPSTYGTYVPEYVPLFPAQNHYNRGPESKNPMGCRNRVKIIPKRNSFWSLPNAVRFIVRHFFAAYRAFHRPISTPKLTEESFFTKGEAVCQKCHKKERRSCPCS